MNTYLKTAFTKPKEIYIARNMKNTHFFSLLFLVTVALTVLSLFQFIPALNHISDDIDEIKQSVPDFELSENQLESSTASYIYQTDTMFFYFDSENRMDTEVIDQNMETSRVPLAVGLLKDGLYINLVSQSYFVPYSNVSNLTADDLQLLIADFGEITPGMVALFVVILFVSQFFVFLYEFFLVGLLANLIAMFRGVRLRLYQVLKIALLAIMPPILLVHAISVLIFPLLLSFEIVVIMSLIVFYRSMTELKDRIDDSSHIE